MLFLTFCVKIYSVLCLDDWPESGCSVIFFYFLGYKRPYPKFAVSGGRLLNCLDSFIKSITNKHSFELSQAFNWWHTFPAYSTDGWNIYNSPIESQLLQQWRSSCCSSYIPAADLSMHVAWDHVGFWVLPSQEQGHWSHTVSGRDSAQYHVSLHFMGQS